ncbi:MAG: hypothetical protein ABW034_03500 [Steroidobacteraceae bacterium]
MRALPKRVNEQTRKTIRGGCYPHNVNLQLRRPAMRPVKVVVALTTALMAATALADELPTNTLPADPLVRQWWQRFLAIPNSVATDLGETPEACGLGQFGNTWFLSVTGTGEEPITRECTIPQGRKLFVPLITFGCTPFPGETLPQNVQFCREGVDAYDKLTLTIDGKNRSELIERRAQSRSFSAWFPEDNIFDTPGQFDVPAGVYVMVAEGQFALVEGLRAGEHVIHFLASTTDASFPAYDVTFNFRIVAATSITPR